MTLCFTVLDSTLGDGTYDAALARVTEIAALPSTGATAPRPAEPQAPQE